MLSSSERAASGSPANVGKRTYAADIALLACLLTLAAWLVDPRGDFPLNDDWSYGLAVRGLLDHGTFRPTHWTAMPLLSQVCWGAMFCLPAGFSFTALRFSTLLACFLGSVAAYLLARGGGRSRQEGLVYAIALAGNPLAFALAFTFMTDVPFMAMTAGAAYFLVSYLRKGSLRYLMLGAFFSTAAILCRHIGLFLPMAFTAAALMSGRRQGPLWQRSLIPLVSGALALIIFDHAMNASGAMPEIYGSQPSLFYLLFVNPGLVPKRVFQHSLTIWLFLGFFLGPLLILRPLPTAGPRPFWRRVSNTYLVSLLALTVGLVVYHGQWMPLGRGNILLPSGAGPLTLRDVYLLHMDHVAQFPGWFWPVVTIASLLCAALLSERIIKLVREVVVLRRNLARDPELVAVLFALATTLIYLLPLAVLGFFDRYLIPAVVPLGFLVTATARGYPVGIIRRGLAFSMLALMLGFSVAMTHDYLAWNRARWQLLNHWVQVEGVCPTQIDGGFEFNGLMLHDQVTRELQAAKSWWWVVDDQYLVSFGPVPGYEEVDRAGYQRLMPTRQDHVLFLKRWSE